MDYKAIIDFMAWQTGKTPGAIKIQQVQSQRISDWITALTVMFDIDKARYTCKVDLQKHQTL